MGQQLGAYPGQCPVTERISDQIVRLPLYSGLSETDQDRILEAIQEFRVPKLERAVSFAMSAANK